MTDFLYERSESNYFRCCFAVSSQPLHCAVVLGKQCCAVCTCLCSCVLITLYTRLRPWPHWAHQLWFAKPLLDGWFLTSFVFFLLLFSSFGGIYLGTCVFLSSKTFFFLFSGFSLFHSLISGYPGVSNWNLKKKKCVLFCHLHHFCLFWFTFNVVFFIALGFPVEVLKVWCPRGPLSWLGDTSEGCLRQGGHAER